jgi:hypothetical protein
MLSPEKYVVEADGTRTELKLPPIPPNELPFDTPTKSTLYGIKFPKRAEPESRTPMATMRSPTDVYSPENYVVEADGTRTELKLPPMLPDKPPFYTPAKWDAADKASIDGELRASIGKELQGLMDIDSSPPVGRFTTNNPAAPPRGNSTYKPVAGTVGEIVETYFKLGMTKCTAETLEQRQYVAKLTNLSLDKLGVRSLVRVRVRARLTLSDRRKFAT